MDDFKNQQIYNFLGVYLDDQLNPSSASSSLDGGSSLFDEIFTDGIPTTLFNGMDEPFTYL